MMFENLFKRKKGQGMGAFGGAVASVIGLVVLGIVLTVGTEVIDGVEDTTTAGSAGRNVSTDTLEGMQSFGDFQPTISLVVVAAVILSLLGGAFALGRSS